MTTNLPFSREEGIQRARLRFTFEEASDAFHTWGLNCGPAAIAAICGLSLDELRPRMGDFELKRYTNPTLMWQVLENLGVLYKVSTPTKSFIRSLPWPRFGLARVQWEGPWTAPGVPPRVAYRHTHWVGSMRVEGQPGPIIFDVNAMACGGWIGLKPWTEELVPWILKECVPKASGGWYLTHSVEIEPSSLHCLFQGSACS